MPVRSRTLSENGEYQVILTRSDELLSTVLTSLETLGYRLNEAYLVIESEGGEYRACSLSELEAVIALLGYDAFGLSVGALPVPSVDRIIPADTPESGADIIDWIAAHPRSVVVVTDHGRYAGLLANPNRFGLSETVSLLRLHGKLVNLSEDPRADFNAVVSPPRCPHCGREGFFEYDALGLIYVCPGCKCTVKQL